MPEGRLPTHVEVGGLIRAVEAAGGFAMVLQKGERDAGALAIVMSHRGTPARLWERMPQMDGSRKFVLSRTQEVEKPREFQEYLSRRKDQDQDLWIVEIDVADAERFIA